MPASLVPLFALTMASLITPSEAATPEPDPLPQPAPGWSIALAKPAIDIHNPTSIVVAGNGTIYLGQAASPRTNTKGASVDTGSVLAVKGGKSRLFATNLGTITGLEWIDGTLYVVHPPLLTAIRDTDGDGQADKRIDLVTGLGPANSSPWELMTTSHPESRRA